MTKAVAAIVVTYNRRRLLAECIRCLKAQTCKDMDILVIDNASTDGTRQQLLQMIERRELLYRNTGSNLGGAGGFQFGMDIAVQMGYEYVWVMDDDSMPEPTALQALLDAAKKVGEFGYLSGRALWTDGSLCRMNIQRDLMLKNLSDFSQPIIPSGAATFVSLLVPTKVMRRVGLPIGEFFIWADDLEYTRRISREYPCYVIPDSITLHKCESNNGGNIATDVPERIPRYRYAYRNEVFLYRREGPRGWMHLALRTPLHILRVLMRSKKMKWARIRVILIGTWRGLSFNPVIPFPES